MRDEIVFCRDSSLEELVNLAFESGGAVSRMLGLRNRRIQGYQGGPNDVGYGGEQ